ncbi:ribonuclease E/G [Sulfitobacter sp. LCG007]
MKGRTIVLDHIGGREAAALIVDGELDDLLVEADAPTPGTVYRAVADRPVKGQGGMFFRTPDGPAFLRQVKGLKPGQEVLVQVSGYADPGKAIPVTDRLLFKSRYAIVTPDAPGRNVSRQIREDDERDRLLGIVDEVLESEPYGLILRSACDGADADAIAEDIAAMMDLAGKVMTDTGQGAELLAAGDGPHVLAWRDWTQPADIVTESGSFEAHGVLEALDGLRSAEVRLGGGGTMYVEQTRALIAVDVNTGPDTSLAAGIKANMACARLLPRALRLRGFGGQIVLDVAPMPKKDRQAFENALRAAFRRDEIETALLGWTPLGHYELQRKRARAALSEVLA